MGTIAFSDNLVEHIYDQASYMVKLPKIGLVRSENVYGKWCVLAKNKLR